MTWQPFVSKGNMQRRIVLLHKRTAISFTSIIKANKFLGKAA
jgi:hypothetical protein